MEFTNGNDVLAWIAGLHQLDVEGTTTCPAFLKPYHFVLLGLKALAMGPGQLNMPDRVARYAARMRLWECVDQQPPVVVGRRHHADRFFPMRRLRSRPEVENLATDLASIVRTQSGGCDHETHSSVYSMLVELMDNAFSHGSEDGEIHGLACAQTWPGGNLAQIAIADSGIGIRRSFEASERWRQVIEGRNACDLATEYGVSSKTVGHSGYGLTLVRGLAQTCAGNLFIVSGDEAFTARGTVTSRRSSINHAWPGTLVVFEWRRNQPLDSGAVYRAWPDAEIEW